MIALASLGIFLFLVVGGLLASEVFAPLETERRREELRERRRRDERPRSEVTERRRRSRPEAITELPPEFTAPCTTRVSPRSVAEAVDERTLEPSARSLLSVDERWVEFQSADGLRIPGLLVSPREGGPYPGIVWVHGGIKEQTNPAVVRAIARNGYVVLGVDYRGSAGHGRELVESESIADEDVDDVLAAGRYLATQPAVDPDRMAVAGGSRGGAMSLLAAIREPALFDAVGAFYPIVDWACALALGPGRVAGPFLESFGGTPEEVPETYIERSPYYRADEIEVPVYMAHGLRDRHPPATETEKMTEALEEEGAEVTSRYYHDLSHGFIEEEGADSALWGDFFRFLDRHL